jgi:hypothetical protein
LLVVAYVAWSLSVVVHQLSHLPAVWRGERLASLPRDAWRGPEVNHRSFPAYVGFLVLVPGGLAVLLGAAALGWMVLGIVGAVAAMFGVLVAFPQWLSVNAVNRPRFLVPPAYRDERGWLTEWRARWRSGGTSVPNADHVVQLVDVRAPDGDDYPPYFVAICDHRDRGWSSDPLGPDNTPGAEARVRAQAAAHSPHLTGPHRPLG